MEEVHWDDWRVEMEWGIEIDFQSGNVGFTRIE